MPGCDHDYAEHTDAPTKLNALTRERVAEMMRELEPLDEIETQVERLDVSHSTPSIAPRLPGEAPLPTKDAPQTLMRLRPRTRVYWAAEFAVGVAAFLVVLIPSLYLLFG